MPEKFRGAGTAPLVTAYRAPLSPEALAAVNDAEAVIIAHRAPICPECRSGKHRSCDGSALDERADDIVECRCPPAFHPEKRN